MLSVQDITRGVVLYGGVLMSYVDLVRRAGGLDLQKV